MFFNVGGLEILVIAMVALIAVGPEQLPGLMRKIGKYASQARSMSTALRDEFMSGIEEVQDIAKPESWMGSGSADDPIVPEGFADRVKAESKNGSPQPSDSENGSLQPSDSENGSSEPSNGEQDSSESPLGDGGGVEPLGDETATTAPAAETDPSGATVEPPATTPALGSAGAELSPAAPKPRVSKIAQANSSQAVTEAAAAVERLAAEAESVDSGSGGAETEAGETEAGETEAGETEAGETGAEPGGAEPVADETIGGTAS